MSDRVVRISCFTVTSPDVIAAVEKIYIDRTNGCI